jgi:uncharacterized membrane-anchored protein YjiN (DUF445 family)
MKRFILLIIIALIVSISATQAQDAATRFQKQHLKQTEASLVNALNSESVGMQATAAQTLRQLEWAFPEEEFKSTITPLIRIVKDEKGETHARILAAIALDGLHSDLGDEAIAIVAKSSTNKSVQELASALIVTTGR